MAREKAGLDAIEKLIIFHDLDSNNYQDTGGPPAEKGIMTAHVKELPPPDDSKHYLALVKQVLEDFKSSGNSDVQTQNLQLLVTTYLNIPGRIAAKRVIASFFQNLEVESQSRVERGICEQLSCRLHVGATAGDSLAATRRTVDTIASLMENFKLGKCAKGRPHFLRK